ncbi:uncharacterized protein N7484_008438 [Penicillium longicatenatum]|uniref:uncharacterized protein n=1 Tax=Penicillium longicatenatum TaxID=1561947 RepID=UPI002548A290|nr:uncharacterized protein N7484_008438 [Penicillium longicatenatum]KAJ5635125.1 hypothetical protein N7484_008438 [Penicillium longicatenatum]
MRSKLGISPKHSVIHRFEQIPDQPHDGMHNPNDVTIDIPLTDAPSHNGTGHWGSGSGSTKGLVPPAEGEKQGIIAPGRRRRIDSDMDIMRGKASEASDDGTINAIGRIYQAIYNFSIVTRYMIYVVPIGLLIAIPIIVGATAAPNAKIAGVHIYWFFTWIEVVWVSLWGCKVMAKFLPWLFQLLCGIVSSGTRKYALILRALETPLTLVLWCVVSLVTFIPIMTENPNKQNDGDTSEKAWEKSVKNVLLGFLVCSLIYLGQKAIVQLISISYHRKQFDSKIKEAKRNVYLVGLLFEASRNMFPMYCPEFSEDDSTIMDPILSQATKKTKRSSIMPLRMVQDVGRTVGQQAGRLGDKVQAAVGNVASELTGKQMFNNNTTHAVVVSALERKRCAAALARRVWMSFVVEGRDSLYIDDIVEVLGPGHEAEADECFAMLDKDGNGDISLDEMILTVTELGRTRKALNHSMHDVDQAIGVLDGLLFSVAAVIGVLVFISFVTTGFGTVIAAGATSLLSLSFVFSTTCQEVLGSCIFLFVKHPFDIGDRVDVSDKDYIVERISLLFTVFRSINDHRLTQVPNNILNSLWVDNLTRANAMHERLTVPVAFDTTFAEVEALRAEMELFVRDKENSRDFQPEFNVEVIGVGDLDKLQLQVDIRHKSNWAIEAVRSSRRSKFMCALVLAMRKLKIRAPGVERPEEESKDGEDGDDKGENPDDVKKSTLMEPAAAAAVADDASLAADTAQATGIDRKRSSGTLTQRGSTNPPNEAAIAAALNTRSSNLDLGPEDTNALHRTATNASSQGARQLSVKNGATGSIGREPSTGHRKAGLRVSYNEHDPMPAPLSPVPAGLTPSTSSVPILQTPAPPGSRGSARYEPTSHIPNPDQTQPTIFPIIGSPESGTYNTSYYNSHSDNNNHYESVELGGFNGEQNRPHEYPSAGSQSHYEERYDPVSPPSIYSPPQNIDAESSGRRPSFLSRTLKREKSNQNDGHDS